MKMEKVLRSALLLLLAAALCLSMAACTQTPAESSPVSETQTPETAASEKASPEDDMPEDAGTEETPSVRRIVLCTAGQDAARQACRRKPLYGKERR